MQDILLTTEGATELKAELNDLITNVRPKVIQTLKEAREQGDLSENADYDAAKNEQARVEARILEIQQILENSKIIAKTDSKTKKIRLGSVVTIKYLKNHETETFKIVSPIECDPTSSPMKISNESPLAKLLVNREVGEKLEVKGVQNPYEIEIVDLH